VSSGDKEERDDRDDDTRAHGGTFLEIGNGVASGRSGIYQWNATSRIFVGYRSAAILFGGEMQTTSMITRVASLLAALALVAAACGDDTGDAVPETDFDFEGGPQGWVSGFADLPADAEPEFFELESDWRPLPDDLEGDALYVRGHNHSDDLWMYWRRAVEGLEADTTYEVDMVIEMASNVPAGLVGIGGSPGESVFVKAGASTVEPEADADDAGWLRMNVDKGNQSEGGDDAVVVGTIANPNIDPETADGLTYELMTLDSTGLGLTATTDSSGTLWVFVGSDSGFEGATALYYSRIEVELTPAE